VNYYAGIDVSMELSSVCIVDATEEIVKEAKVESHPAAMPHSSTAAAACVGSILMPEILLLLRAPFLFGYAKPVPVNFNALRNPRRDMRRMGRWRLQMPRSRRRHKTGGSG